MVSGKIDKSPTLLHSPKVKKKVTQLEPDSGYAAEHTPPCPRASPSPSEQTSGCILDASLQNHSSGSSNVFTDMPVPLSTAESVNVEPYQQRLDSVDYQPQSAMFTVGSGTEIHKDSESSGLLDTGEEGTDNEQHATSMPVQEISDEPLDALSEAAAHMYLSSGMIARLKELEEQKKKVEVLEKRLEKEIEAKNALQQERDELETRLEQYQEFATNAIKAAEDKIKEKTTSWKDVKKRFLKFKQIIERKLLKWKRRKEKWSQNTKP